MVRVLKKALRPLFRSVSRIFYFIESLFLPRRLQKLRYGRPRRIRVPTYDGSGQAVHPDIMGPEAAGGMFVLAFTPYPFTDDSFENPSIVVSSDGLRFREEKPGINPLALTPETDHNDDPDILFADGAFNMFYLETRRPKGQNLNLLRSVDRLHWTCTTIASYNLAAAIPDPLIVSPALIKMNGEIRLFYVNTSRNPFRIEYLESHAVATWDIKDIREPSFDREAITPWHVDVVKDSGVYYMLITDVEHAASGGMEYDLYIAKSSDLQNWRMASRKIFRQRPFGSPIVYRSTALCDGDDIFIYFSYKSRFKEWKIAVVRERLSDLFADE